MFSRRQQHCQRAPRQQRGYNLAEVGIILAVVGMVLGASIVPLGELWRSRAYDSVKQDMRAVQDAILGYALNHQTIQRDVTVISDNDNNSERYYTIPEGRPYLPCPDVNGDGLEDRGNVPEPGIFTSTAAVTIDLSTAVNQLINDGNCVASRGLLPWKTLGVNAADRWGNRYTYHVDDIFASAIYGFNQDTIVDSFDRRVPVVPNSGEFFYSRRDSTSGVQTTFNGISYSFASKRNPLVICGTDNDAPCAPPGSGVDLRLEAGQIARAPLIATRRQYQRNDVVEGVVYAIVSHGSNGFGAVNHQRNLTLPYPEVRCNYPYYNETPTSARFNVQDDYDHLAHEAVNLPFVDDGVPGPIRYCPPVAYGGTNLNDGYMTFGPRTKGIINRQEFDDVVMWTPRADLLKYLSTAQKLPQTEVLALRAYED